MIWRQPWAWLGLLLLAVPVLIHLLSRRNARVQPFPTLRFLQASPLLLARRTRLTDLTLMAVRMAILGCAVAALAQPYLLTANRQELRSRTLARAIVVDTSASMLRAAQDGVTAIEVARQEAGRLAEQAGFSLILESAQPAQALAGAGGWLALQPARRELVVLSDFQLGTLEPGDLATLAPDVGVELRGIHVLPQNPTREFAVRQGPRAAMVRTTLAPAHIDVEWTAQRAADTAADRSLIVLGGAENDRARAAEHAASVLAAGNARTFRPIVMVFPDYEQWAEALQAARPLNDAWMADLLTRIRDDALLAAAAATALVGPDTVATALTVLARTTEGNPVLLAARGSFEDRDHLFLFCRAHAGSLTSAALFAAVLRGLSAAPPVQEREPAQLNDQQLEELERPAAAATASAATQDSGPSDGRWLWLLVLALLVWESRLRRTTAGLRAPEPVP
jgi:hypothetical protein